MLSRRSFGLAMFAAVLLMLGMAPAAMAADDATGTWKWSQAGRGGQGTPTEVTLKLKQDGDKLTGTIATGTNEPVEIKDGKVKDGEVTFTVVRKFNDREMTMKYTAKVTGDTIKGKSATERNGQVREREFEGKRVKE